AALPRLCTRRALPRFSKRRASTVFTKAAFHGCREGVLVGEGSWRERGTRQGLKAPTYLGDERGPEGPLFHGGAESVLFTVFKKARFHGGVESVLFTVFEKCGLLRSSRRHPSSVVQKACSSTAFEKALFHGYSLSATACGIRRAGK